MKTLIYSLLSFLLLFSACTDVKKPSDGSKKHISKAQSDHTAVSDTSFAQAKDNLKNFEKGKVKDELKLANGIKIKWIIKGKAKKFTKGEMALISYRLALPDGRIVDGNNRINLPFIPFVVGYSMQTAGWDLAFTHLAPGDFAKIEIPAALAYGSKAIKGVIPANTDNWLYVKVVSRVSPSIDADGVRSWKLAEGEAKQIGPDESKEIAYQFMASTASRSNAINARKFPLRYVPGQKTVVPGLRKILKNAHQGDRYYVVLSPKQAYGQRGYGDVIGPNESVFFLLDVVGVRAI
jgi:FKBP-type peptidyl-prolyl cis-trans isomerase